ncbi:N-acetylornithine carbamoyltransferase [Muriicola marianensis]|uniref:N-succinylornithine carbamoyltransferase n=1 Tax=Muriicola marianensis TaxID=1324801 RepID=A0ABQ1QZU9_9FLAO|nr:N-acetylornithine carbamoyltransferase [Muriicola marianensis]GGD53139.1 N-acetylornithine carbamoyltransferase [Muriicola marianensis]
MKHFLHVNDIDSSASWLSLAAECKKEPFKYEKLGKGKVLGLLFFNNSLRTRLSTQKAAYHLGMHCMIMNIGSEGWALEFEDGTIMDQGKAEHIKEAAQVISQYCDVLGVRAFASLEDKEKDEAEQVLNGFKKYAGIPVLNMESATGHPLQALADLITITEHQQTKRPKVVLSWAPHPRALPQAVANSFTSIMRNNPQFDFCVTHPRGYELNPEIIGDSPVYHDQNEALKDADFVYVKNWSASNPYGAVLNNDPHWMITPEKLGKAYFMHCLPVRRNVIVEDAVLDGNNSLVIEQANNRTYAAQAALIKILESL